MFVKFLLFLKRHIDSYLYTKIYLPKHADKDFWGDDF